MGPFGRVPGSHSFTPAWCKAWWRGAPHLLIFLEAFGLIPGHLPLPLLAAPQAPQSGVGVI